MQYKAALEYYSDTGALVPLTTPIFLGIIPAGTTGVKELRVMNVGNVQLYDLVFKVTDSRVKISSPVTVFLRPLFHIQHYLHNILLGS